MKTFVRVAIAGLVLWVLLPDQDVTHGSLPETGRKRQLLHIQSALRH